MLTPAKVPPFRNNWDVRIYYEVYIQNEYGLDHFEEDDVVIDLGGQAGYFAILAADRGSKNVYTFEANPDNFEHMQRVIEGRQRSIVSENTAVWRSDASNGKVKISVADGNENTGMGCTIFNQGVEVKTRSLDSILSQFEKVRFLKIDVEGAEFPIILTSTRLGIVEEIVGEIHEVHNISGLDESARIPGYSMYMKDDIVQYLLEEGFDVTVVPMSWSEKHFIFRAKKI